MSIVDVQALLRGLSGKAATIERIPTIVFIACHTHTFRCENFSNFFNFSNSCYIAVAEVEDEVQTRC